MQYVVKDLGELAEMLRLRAVQEYDLADRAYTARAADPHRASGSAWLSAASMVKDTRFQPDVPLAEEYRIEYAAAVFYAGQQIWASMQRRAGDPRWELGDHRGEIFT